MWFPRREISGGPEEQTDHLQGVSLLSLTTIATPAPRMVCSSNLRLNHNELFGRWLGLSLRQMTGFLRRKRMQQLKKYAIGPAKSNNIGGIARRDLSF